MEWGKLAAKAATITTVSAALLFGAIPAAAQADSSVTFSTTPTLAPVFDPLITDYVTTCPGGSVSVAVTDTDGTSVSVAGQPAQTSSFQANVTLNASQAFTVVIGTSTYNIRCLPADFPAYTSNLYPGNGVPQAAYYLVTPGAGYVALFNNYGVPVWWYKQPTGNPIDANVLSNGNLSWAVESVLYGFGLPGDVSLHTYTLTGTQLTTLNTFLTPTDIHEGMQLPNGNFVVSTYALNRYANLTSVGLGDPYPVLDSGFQELTPAGRVVYAWYPNRRIQPVESQGWTNQLDPYPGVTGTVWDEFHLNSVAQDGSNWLVSMRHTNALYLISGRTGAVIWKLGGTHTSRSLTIVGDPNATTDFGGQHDARVLPNGDISVYDDGTNRGRPPRGLVFKIYPLLRVAVLVQTISDSTGVMTQESPYTGSFRALPGGHYVIDWVLAPSSAVDEVVPTSPTTSVPVLRIAFASPNFTYRAVPVMPGVFTDAQLQTAMDSMNPSSGAAH